MCKENKLETLSSMCESLSNWHGWLADLVPDPSLTILFHPL